VTELISGGKQICCNFRQLVTSTRLRQGCQIFQGAIYQNWKNIPNYHKILYPMAVILTKWPQNRPNGRKIDQMAIKYTNIYDGKTLHNLPKLLFLA
jgi:hypothetical protein